jgi:hypothetical protein
MAKDAVTPQTTVASMSAFLLPFPFPLLLSVASVCLKASDPRWDVAHTSQAYQRVCSHSVCSVCPSSSNSNDGIEV